MMFWQRNDGSALAVSTHLSRVSRVSALPSPLVEACVRASTRCSEHLRRHPRSSSLVVSSSAATAATAATTHRTRGSSSNSSSVAASEQQQQNKFFVLHRVCTRSRCASLLPHPLGPPHDISPRERRARTAHARRLLTADAHGEQRSVDVTTRRSSCLQFPPPPLSYLL